jgi:hypothetical protein
VAERRYHKLRLASPAKRREGDRVPRPAQLAVERVVEGASRTHGAQTRDIQVAKRLSLDLEL